MNLEKQSQKGNCKRFLEQTKTDINSAIRETAGRITRGRATGLKNNERAESGEKKKSLKARGSFNTEFWARSCEVEDMNSADGSKF